MMTISIRLPKPDDLDAIVRLQRDALDSHRAVSDLAMELSGPHGFCHLFKKIITITLLVLQTFVVG